MIPPVTQPPAQPDPVVLRRAREAYQKVQPVAGADQQGVRDAVQEPPRWPEHIGRNIDIYA